MKLQTLCPYCKGAFSVHEELTRCPACWTAHHLRCWSEYGQCSIFGCSGQPPVERLKRNRVLSLLSAGSGLAIFTLVYGFMFLGQTSWVNGLDVGMVRSLERLFQSLILIIPPISLGSGLVSFFRSSRSLAVSGNRLQTAGITLGALSSAWSLVLFYILASDPTGQYIRISLW
jgi:Prokaryotic RING finger family 1